MSKNSLSVCFRSIGLQTPNTIYIQKALDKLREDGLEIFDDDVARLSPLQYKHINVLGRYSFAINENVMKGELRQLNCEPKP